MKHLKLYEEFNNPKIKKGERKILDLICKLLQRQLDTDDMNYTMTRDFIMIDAETTLVIDNEYFYLRLYRQNKFGITSNIKYNLNPKKRFLSEPLEDEEEDEDDHDKGKWPGCSLWEYDGEIKRHSQKLNELINRLWKKKVKYDKNKVDREKEKEVDDLMNLLEL